MTNSKVSFEFFPPSDEAMGRQLWAAVERLAPLQPEFVSVTYGADGSTRTRTHDCVLRMLRETALRVAPHLTCIGASREEVLGIARDYWHQGVRQMVALRGDLPGVVTPGVVTPGVEAQAAAADGVFRYASDLVRGLKETAEFDISVAAYPEGHPESGSVDADLDNLKRKVEAGASRAITQFFFDTDVFLRYRDRCAAAGLDIPLVPGILPITRFPQLARFAARCGASVPDWLRSRFDGLEDDAETRSMIAAHVAIEQVQQLRRHGVNEFHFYTLNRAELTYAICHAIGIRPAARRPGAGGVMQPRVLPARSQAFVDSLQRRLVILDGAMGTMIQRHRLGEAQFRGERFAAWPTDLRGNNDLLVLTQPDIIAGIHREYFLAGAHVVSTNTFNSTPVSQSDYRMESLVGELNLAAARLARRVADEVTAETGVQRFVAGALGPTRTYRVAVAGRQRSRFPQHHLR